jgi:hypothetical protein
MSWIWEIKPPGTLWAIPGLLRDSLTQYFNRFPNSCIAITNLINEWAWHVKHMGKHEMHENFGWTSLWEWTTYKHRHPPSQWCEECSCFVQGGPWLKVFCIFLSSWRNDVFNYATSAAFQILSTSLTPSPFDVTSTRNVVKKDKHSRENCILYRRCHVRIYF